MAIKLNAVASFPRATGNATDQPGFLAVAHVIMKRPDTRRLAPSGSEIHFNPGLKYVQVAARSPVADVAEAVIEDCASGFI